MRMRRIQIQKARKHSILQQGKKSICPVCGAGLRLRGRVRASSFKSLPTSASVPPSTTTPDPLLEQRDRQAGGETESVGDFAGRSIMPGLPPLLSFRRFTRS